MTSFKPCENSSELISPSTSTSYKQIVSLIPKRKKRFELLYENSEVRQQKFALIQLERLRREREKMIPKISQKAKRIRRDGKLCFERLSKVKRDKQPSTLTLEYNFDSDINNKAPKTDVNNDLYIIGDEIKNEEYKKLYEKSNRNKSDPPTNYINFIGFNSVFNYYNGCTFHPQLNEKSLSLISSVGQNSAERLFSLSKKERENLEEIKNNRKKEESKYKRYVSSYNEHNKYEPPFSGGNERCEKMYYDGLEEMKKRERVYLNNKRSKENLYKSFSFTPKINRQLKMIISESDRKGGGKINTDILTRSANDIYNRNITWQQTIRNKITKKQELKKLELNQLNLFTFSPQINKTVQKNDVKFMQKARIEYDAFNQRMKIKQSKDFVDELYGKKRPKPLFYGKKLELNFIGNSKNKTRNVPNTKRINNNIQYDTKVKINVTNNIRTKRKMTGITRFFEDESLYADDIKNVCGKDNKSCNNDNSNCKVIKDMNKTYESGSHGFTLVDAVRNLMKEYV